MKTLRIHFTALIVFASLFLYLSSYSSDTESAKSITFTNSIGIRFVLIKAGDFMMGSEKGTEDEKPVHKVSITEDFYLGIHEVTQSQYIKVMGDNPSRFRGSLLPVENVSWKDAQEFCRRLSEKEGREYRLPTEEEWEYACRAGTKTEYFWGDDFDKKHVYVADNTKGKTQEVGVTKPNPWGVYDMSGNVWEWCLDWYSQRAYRKKATDNSVGDKQGQFRVARGGSYDRCKLCSRSAYRGSRLPETKSSTIGFRVVLVPEK